LTTDLLNARLEGTKPLETAEMLSIINQLLVAGNETTTNLLASAMMLLLRNSDQMRLVIASKKHRAASSARREITRGSRPGWTFEMICARARHFSNARGYG
jgi:cytochrome P450